MVAEPLVLDTEPSPEVVHESRELHRLVIDAIARLSEEQRDTVELHYVEGLKLWEIAALVEVPVGTIKARLHRARARLRRVLAEAVTVGRRARDAAGEALMIEVTVEDVIVRSPKTEPATWLAAPKDNTLDYWRVVLLKERAGDRVLPIWLHPSDGDWIAMRLVGLEFFRPVPHDLIARLLQIGDLHVEKVAVTGLREKARGYARGPAGPSRRRDDSPCSRRDSVGGDGLRHLPDDHRRVHGRRVDLEHFDVVRALQLVVDDAGRLEHAVALAERALALAFVDEPDPALEHVEHLEVALVLVQACRVQVVSAPRVRLDPDHVSAELPVGRLVDPEVAVLHEAPQSSLVHRVLGQARAEGLLGLAHRRLPFVGGGALPPIVVGGGLGGPLRCLPQESIAPAKPALGPRWSDTLLRDQKDLRAGDRSRTAV